MSNTSDDETGAEQGKKFSPEFEANKFKPGQSGNPAGRPKGARSKLSESFLQDALDAWTEDGKTALKLMATEKPADFAKMVAGIVPKEDKLDVNMSVTEVATTYTVVDDNPTEQ